MSTENGSAAHKGSYINGLKRCFQHGLEESIAERDQNKDWFRKYREFRTKEGLSVDPNLVLISGVSLLKSVCQSVALINMSLKQKLIFAYNHKVFLALN